MNLIINANLSSDPPSEGLYFRFLTMVAQKDLDYCVLLESQHDMIDMYYHFLKKKGWFDHIDDIIVPEWKEEGVRLDTELTYPMTIRTKYIRCENTLNLLGQIKTMRTLPSYRRL
jgi:hypothetical protein